MQRSGLAGRRVGRRRVERLVRRHGVRGLIARPRRVQTTGSRHAFPVAPTLLDRAFAAAAPNQVWLADLACIAIGEGWPCMAAIMGLHTRKGVGWSMRDHLRAALATSALLMARPAPAARHRPCSSLGQGHPRRLRRLPGSPGPRRRHPVHEPARQAAGHRALESVFHTLKTERVHHGPYATRIEAKRDLFAYVDGFYNRQRLHSALDYRTPDQAEQRAARVA